MISSPLEHTTETVISFLSTNIPGVFGAGDIKHKRFRQITTAVSDGTTAALAAEAYLRTKNSQ